VEAQWRKKGDGAADEQQAKKSPLQRAGKKYWKQCEQCRTE